jgi:nucleoside-diphosphate-sugar epimerase
MKIIGQGMIARSLTPYLDQAPDTLIFASGVANSLTTDQQAYEREILMLTDALRCCQQQNLRIVYFSSGGAIHGSTNEPRNELTPTMPMTAYGKHKRACETAIINAGVQHLIFRLANLVGAGQNPSQLIPALINQIKRGRVTLYTKATRDLLDVDDFAHLLIHLLEKKPQSGIYTVASGQSIPIVSIAEEIRDLLSLDAEFDLVEGGDEQRFDIRKLKQVLPNSLNFDVDYFRSVLAKYVSQSASL